MRTKKDDIPPERQKQFDWIESARGIILKWATENSVPLEHVDFVVPFVETDFSLDVYFFYSTRETVKVNHQNGTSARVFEQFKSTLKDLGYPPAWLARTTSEFASKEEVDERFEGSYYYYLR